MTHCSPGPPERHEEPVLPSVTDLGACETSFSDDEATVFLPRARLWSSGNGSLITRIAVLGSDDRAARCA